MKRFLLTIVVPALFAGCLWNVSAAPGPASLEDEDQPREIDWTLVQREFNVRRVVSGDTIEVEYPILGSWETATVKLLGVDAPDRLPHIMTEYKGLDAFAMVVVALDKNIENPELLSLTDRDMLQERVSIILDKKEMPPFRDVRLLDDGWETRTQMWPFIPLRASVKYDAQTKQRSLEHLFAYVYVGNLMLNRFLVEEGFARVHPDHLFDQRAAFEEAEERARRRGIGIWGVK